MSVDLQKTYLDQIKKISAVDICSPKDAAEKRKKLFTCAEAFLEAGGKKSEPEVQKIKTMAEQFIAVCEDNAKKGYAGIDAEGFKQASAFAAKFKKRFWLF